MSVTASAPTLRSGALPLPVPIGAMAATTLLGTLLAQRRGTPLTDSVRGGSKGLATGAGGVGGYLLAQELGADGLGSAAGAGAGALASYMAADRLTKLLGLDSKSSPEAYESPEDEILGKQSAALPTLLLAKAESDRKNYTRKHMLLRKLITQSPQDFIVDSEKNGIVGLTHQPTNFRFHLPKHIIPGDI